MTMTDARKTGPARQDNRLDLETGAFGREFGEVLACSGTSTRSDGYLVNSALTRQTYVYYDWATGKYVTEPR
jgi:hypothetical protein